MDRVGLAAALAALAIGCGGSAFTGAQDTAIHPLDAGGDADPPDEGVPGDGGSGGEGGADDGDVRDGSTLDAGAVDASAGEWGAVDGGHEAGGGPCDGGPLVAHSNGVGQGWQDCAPLATYDLAEATKACDAWAAANGQQPTVCAPINAGGGAYLVCSGNASGIDCVCWEYEGNEVGRVHDPGIANCEGPSGGDPTWE